jgi:hypothetical protein
MRRIYQRKKRNKENSGTILPAAGKTTENSRAHPLLRLQQDAGNQATQELLHTQSPRPSTPISEGDVAEQEAARLADNLAQDHKGSAAVPREKSGTSPATCDTTFQSIVEAIHSAGEPLDPAVRSETERHFERDFGRVRVHHNERANGAAAAVNADAFAAGSISSSHLANMLPPHRRAGVCWHTNSSMWFSRKADRRPILTRPHLPRRIPDEFNGSKRCALFCSARNFGRDPTPISPPWWMPCREF